MNALSIQQEGIPAIVAQAKSALRSTLLTARAARDSHAIYVALAVASSSQNHND